MIYVRISSDQFGEGKTTIGSILRDALVARGYPEGLIELAPGEETPEDFAKKSADSRYLTAVADKKTKILIEEKYKRENPAMERTD